MQSLSINDMQTVTGGRRKFFFRYWLLFILLIFCTFQFHIYKICGFSIYPDEFGYWASAAQTLGYDWSATAALGSYYSFGYGMILTPILWLFRNGRLAYQAAVAVNMLLQCGSAGLLWGIFKRLHQSDYSNEKKMQSVLAVGIAVFYPPWSFYMQMTLTEPLLMFLYVLICYQIIMLIDKTSITRAAFLALSLIYIYFVHMRTVAVIIAAIITFILYAWKTPSVRKSLIIAFMVLAAGLLCGIWVKERVTNTVYAVADEEFLSVNDYAGHIQTFKDLLSLQGIKDLFLSSIGKLYYLVVASFGLFIPGIYICIKKTWIMLRQIFARSDKSQEQIKQNQKLFYLFVLLSMFGQFVITAIVCMRPGRLDGFVYGRYNEHILPVFIGIGLLAFCESKCKIRLYICCVIVSVITFVITFWSAMYSGLTVMQGYFAAGISYLSNDWNYHVITEFPKAFCFGMTLVICVMTCIYFGIRSKKYICSLAVILSIEILLTLCLGRKYIGPFNDVNYDNLRITEYVKEYDEPVNYLYGGGFQYIDLLQFDMKDKKIEIIKLQDIENRSGLTEVEHTLPTKGFLIVDQGCKYLEEIEKKYQRCTDSYAFILFTTK